MTKDPHAYTDVGSVMVCLADEDGVWHEMDPQEATFLADCLRSAALLAYDERAAQALWQQTWKDRPR
jgi:hypothetical protein